MNSMLDDDALRSLLGEAAGSFPVPLDGPGEVRDDVTPRPRLQRRLVRLTAVAAAVVAAAFVVQSIDFGGASTRNQLASDSSPGVLLPYATGGGTTGGTSGTSGTTSGGATSDSVTKSAAGRALSPSALQVPASSPLVGSTTTSAGRQSATTSVPAGTDFADGARIVKTGSISLIVEKGRVSGTVVKLHALASASGGYVSNEKSQEYGDDPTSTTTLRVPVAQFDTVLQKVRDTVAGGVGKVDSASSSGADVTAQYSDLEAQIQSHTAARARFLTILSRANTIGETLSVQQRVDDEQAAIDRLKGQRQLLAKQSDFGTLTVTVGEKPKALAKVQSQSGISKSWDNAKHGFTSGVESLISRSGRALLVLIVALVALVILRSGWRLARRRLV